MDNKNKFSNQRKPSPDINMFGGKLPPQAIEIEKAVLGALIIDGEAINLLTEIINENSFYVESHQKIFNSIVTLSRNNSRIDMLTVVEQLKKDNNIESVGGAYFISELSNLVSSSANIEYHARIIQQKAIQRKVIEFSTQAINEAYDDSTDVFDIIDGISDNLIEISGQLLQDSKESWQESTENYVIDIANKVSSGIKETGLKVGLSELDQTIAGFRSGLYIIAGRPSMGKSALGFELACRVAELKKGKVGIFSLEMSKTQLINRIVARYSQINQTRLMNANITPVELTQLHEGGATASKLDFLINDKSTISINQIVSKAKVWAQKNKIGAIFVDYVQLVKGTNKQRHLEIGEISKGLKALSKDLDIPVFALAQLGREKDAGKSMPRMSELRESGDLEQDADVVMLLYRPEYYGIVEDSDGISTAGLTKIIVEKNRNGAVNLKGVNVRSNLAINRYEDWNSSLPLPTINEKRFEQKGAVSDNEDEYLPF